MSYSECVSLIRALRSQDLYRLLFWNHRGTTCWILIHEYNHKREINHQNWYDIQLFQYERDSATFLCVHEDSTGCPDSPQTFAHKFVPLTASSFLFFAKIIHLPHRCRISRCLIKGPDKRSGVPYAAIGKRSQMSQVNNWEGCWHLARCLVNLANGHGGE